jgi:hypothetical protein
MLYVKYVKYVDLLYVKYVKYADLLYVKYVKYVEIWGQNGPFCQLSPTGRNGYV